MKCVCSDLTATQTVEILEMNLNTISCYYVLFRTKICEYQTKERAEYAGSVELDETYFNSQLITDDWRGYNGLVDFGFDIHLCINKKIRKETKYVGNGVHINGFEAFWSFVKRRLAKFNSTRKNLDFHLKESESHSNKNFAILFQ